MLDKIIFHPGDIIDTPTGTDDWSKVFGIRITEGLNDENNDELLELFYNFLLAAESDTAKIMDKYCEDIDSDSVNEFFKYIHARKIGHYAQYTKSVFLDHGVNVKFDIYYGPAFKYVPTYYSDYANIAEDFTFPEMEEFPSPTQQDIAWDLQSIQERYDTFLRAVCLNLTLS